MRVFTHISDSMGERATDIVNYIAQNSKDYIELIEKILQLQEEVKSYLNTCSLCPLIPKVLKTVLRLGDSLPQLPSSYFLKVKTMLKLY